MYPEREEDVTNEQLARLVWTPERRQHRHPETSDCGVIRSHGLVVQIANSRRFGVLCDCVQRSARQIKKQVVIWFVEQSDRITSQVMEINLSGPQVTHRH